MDTLKTIKDMQKSCSCYANTPKPLNDVVHVQIEVKQTNKQNTDLKLFPAGTDCADYRTKQMIKVSHHHIHFTRLVTSGRSVCEMFC